MNKYLRLFCWTVFCSVVGWNLFIVAIVLNSILEQIGRDCSFAICYWGYENMPWIWHSPTVYFTAWTVLVAIVIYFINRSIGDFKNKKHYTAFLYALAPTVIVVLFYASFWLPL